jgi:hypothetical protein
VGPLPPPPPSPPPAIANAEGLVGHAKAVEARRDRA